VTPHVWDPVGGNATPLDPRGRYPRSAEVQCRRCRTRILTRQVAVVDSVEGWRDCAEMLAAVVMEEES